MKPISNQTVLKGVLLVALAANVSWQTKTNFSADLASEQGTSAANFPPPPDGVTLRQAPSGVDAAQAGNAGPRPDGAARSDLKPENLPEAVLLNMKVCGQDVVVKFHEELLDNAPAVRAQLVINGRDIGATNRNLTLAKFKELKLKQEAFMKLLGKEAARTCAADDITLDSTKVSEQGLPPAPQAADLPQDDAATLAQRRAAKIARGLRNCTGDEQGKALKADDKIKCHLGRITTDETEDIADMDEMPGRKPRKGITAETQFSASVDYLIGEISSLLTTKYPEDRNEGNVLKRQLESALREARSNGVISRSEVSAAQARLEHIEDGQVVNERTHVYQQQASQIEQQISQLQQQLVQAQQQIPQQQLQQNPTYSQMMQELQSLQKQKQSIGSTLMPQDSFFNSYKNLQTQGIVQEEEYNAFTSSYNNLMRMLSDNQSMLQSQTGILPGTAIRSSNATTFRNGPNSNNRSNGLNMTNLPQVSSAQSSMPVELQMQLMQQQPNFQTRMF